MKRAIVTGGSRGIGLAVAEALIDEGGSVTITGLDRARLDQVAAQLGARAGQPGRVHAAVVDVRNRAAVDACVAETERRFGGIDTLVNNAGVGVFCEAAAMSDEEWDRVIATNLTGAFYCTRAAIPALKRAGGGWIINVASLAGRNFFPNGAAYCASKAGLIAFSEAVMQEVRADRIRVSVVMPGSVATGFMGQDAGPADSWKLTPQDVAQVVMDLLRHPGRSLPSKVEIRPAVTK